MEGDMNRSVRIAASKTVERKKQTNNANDLLSGAKKRKRKENSSETRIIPKQENGEVPSLMSDITLIGDSVLQRKKRTTVSRRRPIEMTGPMRRLAYAAQHVFLPPKDTNGKPNVRFLIPPMEDKNKLIIHPKEESESPEHPNDETGVKRRRGRPSKLQVATSGSPRTKRSPNNPISARRKQGSDKKPSLLGRVHHGVDQSGGAHQTPLDKNEPKKLDPRPQPYPLLQSPQPWPAMSPDWLKSEPYNQPFMNIGSSSTNGADYKGKQVMVDDGNDKKKKPSFKNNFNFLLGSPKEGITLNEGSNKNAATDKGSNPPRDRDDIVRIFHQFLNELKEAKKKPILTRDGLNKKTSMLNMNQRKNVKSKVHVSPSTYLRPAAKKSGGGGAASSVQSPPLTQGMQPPKQRDAQSLLPWGGQSRLINDFMNQVQEPPQPPPPPPQGGERRLVVPDSNDKIVQRCAEAIYGKEAFANGVPPCAGPLTAMMLIAQKPELRDSLGVLTHKTTTTATDSHQFLPPPPPPPPPFTASGHDATGQEELKLASTSDTNLLSHNSWAPTNDNQLVHPDTYESIQPPPAHMTPPQNHQAPPPDYMTPPQNHQAPPQVVANPFLFQTNLFQQQSNMFMPTPTLPPQLPPQMAVFGVPNFPGQYLPGYPGPSGDGNWVMGNWGYQGLPPPGN